MLCFYLKISSVVSKFLVVIFYFSFVTFAPHVGHHCAQIAFTQELVKSFHTEVPDVPKRGHFGTVLRNSDLNS